MASNVFEFTVILGDNERKLTLQSKINVFSEYQAEIRQYASQLDGIITKPNTVVFWSEKNFELFTMHLIAFRSHKRITQKKIPEKQ